MPDQRPDNHVSPLSVPLVKNPTTNSAPIAGLNDDKKTDDKKIEKSGTKATAQKTEVPSKTVSGKTPFPFAQILVTAFLLPFFYNTGTESYLFAVSYIEDYYGLKLTSQSRASALTGTRDAGKKPADSDAKKILVITNQTGTFSFKFEKQKLLELAGIDIDDPINGTETINKIKSPEILITAIDSFSNIILNGRGKDVSDFHLKNSIEGKKLATKRLRKLSR